MGGLLFVATRTVGEMAPQPRRTVGSRRERLLVLDPRFMTVLISALVAGTISGSISISVPVVVSGSGGPAAAGIALGLFAGGSAVGGLLFGALRVPGSPTRQLLVLTAGLIAVSSLVALATGALAVSVVLAAAGLFFSPVMIVAYFAAHHAGGERRENSATTWVNTSHNVGAALGSAVTGIIVQAATVPTAVAAITGTAVILLGASAVLGRSHGSFARNGGLDAGEATNRGK